MAKGRYAIIDGKTRKVKKRYAVIDGVTRKIKKRYAIVDGKTRLVWSSEGLIYGFTDDGKFYKTEDGLNWIYISDLPSLAIPSLSGYSLSYFDTTNIISLGKTIIICMGRSIFSYVYSLDNGLTWNYGYDIHITSWKYIKKIVAGNNIYVALIGDEDYEGTECVYSYDLKTWTSILNAPSTTSYYVYNNSLNFVNGYFIWQGDKSSIYSRDGINWTSTSNAIIPSNGYASGIKLIYNQGRYIGLLLTSGAFYRDAIDGVTNYISSLSNTRDIVVFKNNIYVLTMETSSDMGGSTYTSYIYKSTDNGTTFTRVFKTEQVRNLYKNHLGFICTSDILYAKSYDGNYYYTTDGNTWTYVVASSDSAIPIMANNVLYMTEE